MRRAFFLLSLLLCAAFSSHGYSQQHPRSGQREWSLQPHILGSRDYLFAGGAAARLDGGLGIGIGMAKNLNDYFAVGVDLSLSALDYRATVVPGSGNAGASFDSSGLLERATLRFSGTWYLLSSRTTPFLTGGLGATYLDPDLEAAPPASACWNYPWWGQFCGPQAPQHGLTRFSYALGAGLRHDLPRERGFWRALVSGEWIDWPGPPERLGNIEFRVDFGLKY